MMEGRNRMADWTDAELRRRRRKLRRRRALQKRLMIAAMLFCLVAACAISYGSIKTSANSGKDAALKYYTNVKVQKGDTLWALAGEYMDSEQYKDKNAYIAEVCSINHMQRDATLYSGQYITIPYYSCGQ